MQIYYNDLMPPSRNDVQQMVQALFTLISGLERARKGIPAASTLAVLQVIAAHGKVHPSEIAIELGVHQSTITRQVQTLEEAGQVSVVADPNDGRSCTIALTKAGREEVHRLTQIGLDRFALFVAGWETEEIRTLTRLLVKLEQSKADVANREQQPRPGGRRWQSKET